MCFDAQIPDFFLQRSKSCKSLFSALFCQTVNREVTASLISDPSRVVSVELWATDTERPHGTAHETSNRLVSDPRREPVHLLQLNNIDFSGPAISAVLRQGSRAISGTSETCLGKNEGDLSLCYPLRGSGRSARERECLSGWKDQRMLILFCFLYFNFIFIYFFSWCCF